MKKNNNKGFSLVELIVVVLILGILAVAVSPQVMKWVDKSKISSDKDNANALKSSVQTALAEWQGDSNTIPAAGGTDYTANINGTSTTLSDATGWTGLSAKITAITAGDYPKTQYNGAGFTLKVEAGTGKVTVTCEAQSH